jgi:hypothetical protein
MTTSKARLDRLRTFWSADDPVVEPLAIQLYHFLKWEDGEAPAPKLKRWLRVVARYGLPPTAEGQALGRALVRLGVPPHVAREAAARGVPAALAVFSLPDELAGDERAQAEAATALLREVTA